jgi:hypothetical protein
MFWGFSPFVLLIIALRWRRLEHWCNDTDRGKRKCSGKQKSVPVPRCLPKQKSAPVPLCLPKHKSVPVPLCLPKHKSVPMPLCLSKHKTVPVPLCLPKISHELASDRTRTTAVRLALVNIIPATHQLARGGVVGETMRYKPEGSIPDGVTGIFHWPHCGPGDDSASNRNKYQEYILCVKGGRCLRLTSRLSWNLRASISWNPQGLLRPVQGLLYLYIPILEPLPHRERGTFRLQTQIGKTNRCVSQKSYGKMQCFHW